MDFNLIVQHHSLMLDLSRLLHTLTILLELRSPLLLTTLHFSLTPNKQIARWLNAILWVLVADQLYQLNQTLSLEDHHMELQQQKPIQMVILSLCVTSVPSHHQDLLRSCSTKTQSRLFNWLWTAQILFLKNYLFQVQSTTIQVAIRLFLLKTTSPFLIIL